MSKRDRYLLSVVGGLAAVVGLWMLVFSPKLGDLRQARKDVDSAKTSYETARQEAQTFAQARLDFPKAYAEMARLGKSVPTHIDEASLVYQLHHAADRAGVKFQSLTLESDDAAAAGAAHRCGSAPTDAEWRRQPVRCGRDSDDTRIGPAGARLRSRQRPRHRVGSHRCQRRRRQHAGDALHLRVRGQVLPPRGLTARHQAPDVDA